MERFSLVFLKQSTLLATFIIILLIIILSQWFLTRTTPTTTFVTLPILPTSPPCNITNTQRILLYQRHSCNCTRPILKQNSNLLILDETSSSFCSRYSTLRGFHQRIISISMYGPRENSLFAMNTSVNFLHELIADMKVRYPDWILRIYHDISIKEDIICQIECTHNHVDFCNTSSLGTLGDLASYIPAKIWRFLPIGDELVDIMGSRDLDSPLTQRELDAVNEWISSGKAWHAMRDNPWHNVPMLGGMWGFRPELNRTFARDVLRKILDRSHVIHFGGRGDQRFLTENVWPYVGDQVIAHDSFLCTQSYGNTSQPWPTRREHPLNNTNCFVGCVRPCCILRKYPFGECPMACRPKNHTDWTMC